MIGNFHCTFPHWGYFPITVNRSPRSNTVTVFATERHEIRQDIDQTFKFEALYLHNDLDLDIEFGIKINFRPSSTTFSLTQPIYL